MRLGLMNKENQPLQEDMKKPLKPSLIKPSTGETKATQEVGKKCDSAWEISKCLPGLKSQFLKNKVREGISGQ